MWGRPSRGAAISVPLPPPRSGQCNTQMDEFPIHPPLAGSPGGADKCENPKLESKWSPASLWFVNWCVCGGLTAWLGVENLNTIAGCQSLLQQRGELLWELLPVLLPNLLLKTMQYLRDETEDGLKNTLTKTFLFLLGFLLNLLSSCQRLDLKHSPVWGYMLLAQYLTGNSETPLTVSHWAPHLVEHVS